MHSSNPPKSLPPQIQDNVEKQITAILDKHRSATWQTGWNNTATEEATAELLGIITAAKIDTINQIRHSDQRLNHGTIELLAAMSQALNKEKQALTTRKDKTE